MTDVFISYSRKDQDFVRKLYDALNEQEREAWVDWEGIPFTADWWAEIQRGIEAADTFLFIISPDSVISPVCNREVEHAVLHNKRIVPIVRREAMPEQMNQALARHNWLFARDDDDFDTCFVSLIDALNTDLDYVRTHTRLLIRAREWEAKQQDNSYLLRGVELQEAENWLAQSGGKEPKPTELQTHYVLASRRASSARQRTLLASVTGALAITVILALVAIALFGVAENRRQESEARGTEVAQQAATATNALGLSEIRGTEVAQQAGTATNALGLSESRGTEVAQQAATATNALGLSEIRGTEVAQQASTAIAAEATSDRRAVEWRGLAWSVASERALVIENSDLALALALQAQEIPNPPAEVQAQLFRAAYAPGTSRVFSGAHNSWLTSLSLNSDESLLLTTAQEGVLALWDANTGELLQSELFGSAMRLGGGAMLNLNAVNALAFHPTERNIAVLGFYNGTLAVVNVETWTLLRNTDVIDMVNAVAFSPDGSRIAVATARSTASLMLLDAETLDLTALLEGHTETVTTVVFSDDGESLMSGSDDDTARLWNVETGELVQTYGPIIDEETPDLRLNGAVFGPVNQEGDLTVIVATNSGQIISLNRETGKELMRYNVGLTATTIADLAISPDGRTVAAAGVDANVYLWQTADGRLIRQLKGHRLGTQKVIFSADGISLYSAAQDGTARRWYVRSGGEAARLTGFQNQSGASTMALSPDGTIGIVGGALGDPALLVWDLQTGTLLQRLEGHTDSVLEIKLREENGRLLALSSGWDGTIRLWDVSADELLQTYELGGIITSVAFSPNGEQILATKFGSGFTIFGSVFVLDRETGEEIRSFNTGFSLYLDAEYTPDGTDILIGGADTAGVGMLVLIDAASGEVVQEFASVHPSALQHTAFNIDGTRAISSSQDGLIVEWDLQTGREVQRFVGHSDVVNRVNYSSDGRWIVSASYDDTFRIWDEATGIQTLELTADDDGRDSQFASNGTLYTISRDGALTRWALTLDLSTVIAWARDHRYVRDFTCAERQTNRIEPLCENN